MKIKRIVAFLCVLILMVSAIGCSKSKNKTESDPTKEVVEADKESGKTNAINTPTESVTEEVKEVASVKEETGSYQETPIELSDLESGENLVNIICNANGDAQCYTCIQKEKDSIINCYTIKDGKTEKKTVEWANKAIHDAGGTVLQFGQAGDGQCFLFLQDWQELDMMIDGEHAIFTSSRVFENAGNDTDYIEITPKEWNQKDKVFVGKLTGTSVAEMGITKDGVIIYNDGQMNVEAYSIKDQKSVDCSEINAHTNREQLLRIAPVKGNTVYYYSVGDPNIYSYDFTTKKSEAIPCDISLNDGGIAVSDEGDLYISNIGGIYCHQVNTNLWEELVPGNGKVIGSPNYYHPGLAVKEGEHKEFYALLGTRLSSGTDVIACYQFSNEPIVETTDELNVYSLRENKTMREAIQTYQSEHPEIMINYQVAMPVEGEVNAADEIRALNTELLAGKGADILILDGLPADAYIDKGALLDLSDILGTMVSDGTLLKNITDNYVSGDKIYAMPVRFILPVYVAKDDVIAKAGSLKEISQLSTSTDHPMLPYGSYDQVLRMFLYTYYDEFMKDSKTIDPALFTEFLQQVKSIMDNTKIFDQEYEYDENSGLDYIRAYRWYIYSRSYLSQMSTDSIASTGFVDDISEFNEPISSAKEVKGAISTMNDSYIPSGIVGINSATKSEELAKDFIKYLFSEKMQNGRNNDGFPLNANSLESWCNIEPTESEHSWISVGGNGSKDAALEIKGATIEQRHEMKKLLEQATLPTFNNEIVFDMIVEQSLGYLKGEKSLDQAANDTASKINLYLSEQ